MAELRLELIILQDLLHLFTKGELGSPVTISSEAGLIEAFGEPVANNSEYFLSATNYLNYGGTLSVTRVNTDQLKNAVSRLGQSVASVTINNPTTNGKYVSAPSVSFSGGGGTNAAGTAILDADGKSITSCYNKLRFWI